MQRIALLTALALVTACKKNEAPTAEPAPATPTTDTEDKAPAAFTHLTEDRFGDSQVLRYQIPEWDTLSAKQRELLYYLYQAALSGRDIIYDQKFKYNLAIRRTLEAIIEHGALDKNSADFKQLTEYAKKVWFARGIHHDYSKDKFFPDLDQKAFVAMLKKVPQDKLPLQAGQDLQNFSAWITEIIYSPEVAPKGVNLAPGVDKVLASANNFYDGVTEKEAQAYYAKLALNAGPRPPSFGLNTQLVKKNGKIFERPWKVNGMYGEAIGQIVHWLEKAIPVAENERQAEAFRHLVAFYRTGDLKEFDAYNIAWVQDTESRVDVINGFIEVYGDPLAYKGSFESVVSIRDLSATKRIAALASAAQWFEDNAPIAKAHKKEKVVGISAKVINVVVESGDAAPTTPIGINLPNANWIRAEHGSKSVTIGNIIGAYEAARQKSGVLEEFAASEAEVARAKTHGALAYNLKVDLHEVIGHASGKLMPGVGTPKETLKSYSSSLEEGRADLVALYYVMDPKLVELGVMPSLEVGKAAYDGYIRNALLVQMARIEKGKDLEEAHMRNRQLIGRWAMEKGKADGVIERVQKDGKTAFVIRDYQKLRTLFGKLLAEIQRIKSEGDYEAGKALVEGYGVKLDPALHAEVLARHAKLDVPTYYGFIQPRLVPVREGDRIQDVRVEYPKDFMAQQLEYARDYRTLPTYPQDAPST